MQPVSCLSILVVSPKLKLGAESRSLALSLCCELSLGAAAMLLADPAVALLDVCIVSSGHVLAATASAVSFDGAKFRRAVESSLEPAAGGLVFAANTAITTSKCVDHTAIDHVLVTVEGLPPVDDALAEAVSALLDLPSTRSLQVIHIDVLAAVAAKSQGSSTARAALAAAAFERQLARRLAEHSSPSRPLVLSAAASFGHVELAAKVLASRAVPRARVNILLHCDNSAGVPLPSSFGAISLPCSLRLQDAYATDTTTCSCGVSADARTVAAPLCSCRRCVPRTLVARGTVPLSSLDQQALASHPMPLAFVMPPLVEHSSDGVFQGSCVPASSPPTDPRGEEVWAAMMRGCLAADTGVLLEAEQSENCDLSTEAAVRVAPTGGRWFLCAPVERPGGRASSAGKVLRGTSASEPPAASPRAKALLYRLATRENIWVDEAVAIEMLQMPPESEGGNGAECAVRASSFATALGSGSAAMSLDPSSDADVIDNDMQLSGAGTGTMALASNSAAFGSAEAEAPSSAVSRVTAWLHAHPPKPYNPWLTSDSGVHGSHATESSATTDYGCSCKSTSAAHQTPACVRCRQLNHAGVAAAQRHRVLRLAAYGAQASAPYNMALSALSAPPAACPSELLLLAPPLSKQPKGASAARVSGLVLSETGTKVTASSRAAAMAGRATTSTAALKRNREATPAPPQAKHDPSSIASSFSGATADDEAIMQLAAMGAAFEWPSSESNRQQQQLIGRGISAGTSGIVIAVSDSTAGSVPDVTGNDKDLLLLLAAADDDSGKDIIVGAGSDVRGAVPMCDPAAAARLKAISVAACAASNGSNTGGSTRRPVHRESSLEPAGHATLGPHPARNKAASAGSVPLRAGTATAASAAPRRKASPTLQSSHRQPPPAPRPFGSSTGGSLLQLKSAASSAGTAIRLKQSMPQPHVAMDADAASIGAAALPQSTNRGRGSVAAAPLDPSSIQPLAPARDPRRGRGVLRRACKDVIVDEKEDGDSSASGSDGGTIPSGAVRVRDSGRRDGGGSGRGGRGRSRLIVIDDEDADEDASQMQRRADTAPATAAREPMPSNCSVPKPLAMPLLGEAVFPTGEEGEGAGDAGLQMLLGASGGSIDCIDDELLAMLEPGAASTARLSDAEWGALVAGKARLSAPARSQPQQRQSPPAATVSRGAAAGALSGAHGRKLPKAAVSAALPPVSMLPPPPGAEAVVPARSSSCSSGKRVTFAEADSLCSVEPSTAAAAAVEVAPGQAAAGDKGKAAASAKQVRPLLQLQRGSAGAAHLLKPLGPPRLPPGTTAVEFAVPTAEAADFDFVDEDADL